MKVGSIRLRRKPNVWELRLYLGRDENGKVVHKYATFVGGKRDAEKELARLSFELEAEPEYPEPEVKSGEPGEQIRWGPKTTFNDAILAWKENGWEDLSPKTIRDYEGFYRRNIEGSIGKKSISAIGVFEVERYFRELAKGGLGISGIRNVRGILHRAAVLAGKWSGGIIPNPVALADLPKNAVRSEPVRAPSIAEVKAIIQEAEESGDMRMATIIKVIAATGMRRGEAAALRWSDVLFSQSRVVIDEAAITAMGSIVIKSPKTKASKRVVALDQWTLRSLEELRAEQEALAQSMGFSLVDEGFVFSYSPDGSVPPHPDSISHAFTKMVKASGASSDIHLHSLRHFQATLIDPLSSERQKQARLGWSTSHMARHYTDPITEEDVKIASEVGRQLYE
jgi:integrase